MQLLQQPDGRRRFGFFGGRFDDLGDLGGHVRVTADQPFAVEHSQPAEPTEFDGEFRRYQRIGRMGDDGDLEPVRVELPGRRDVLRGAGAPGRHDVDVGEFVSAPGRSAHADLDHVTHERSFDQFTERSSWVLRRSW